LLYINKYSDKPTKLKDTVPQLKNFFLNCSDHDYIYFMNSEQLIIILYAFGNKRIKAAHRCLAKDDVKGSPESVHKDSASALVQTVQGHSQPNLKTFKITIELRELQRCHSQDL